MVFSNVIKYFIVFVRYGHEVFAQTADVNDVVNRMAQMEEKFGELKNKSGNLLNEADHTIDSGKEGGISIGKFQQQNWYVEKNVNMSYEKIKALEEHSLRISGDLEMEMFKFKLNE